MDPVEELRLLKYKASTIKAKEMTEVWKQFLIINKLINNKLFRNMECTHFSYEKNEGSINSYMVYTYDLKIRLADRLNNIDISVLISDEENYTYYGNMIVVLNEVKIYSRETDNQKHKADSYDKIGTNKLKQKRIPEVFLFGFVEKLINIVEKNEILKF